MDLFNIKKRREDRKRIEEKLDKILSVNANILKNHMKFIDIIIPISDVISKMKTFEESSMMIDKFNKSASDVILQINTIKKEKELFTNFNKSASIMKDFSKMLEFFAQYIVYDLKNSPHRGRGKEALVNEALYYLRRKDTFKGVVENRKWA